MVEGAPENHKLGTSGPQKQKSRWATQAALANKNRQLSD
jgi:hypothetical protein